MVEPFAVKDCALIAIATGERAQNLRELRDRLSDTHPGCIYYHFWGGMLRPHFDDPEYQNDFAAWCWHGLHDGPLAERLAVIDPGDYDDIENLRREVIEVTEERLDETELVPWAKTSRQFHFMRSQIVVFDTATRIEDPFELRGLLPTFSVSSIFYHFIDARRRTIYGKNDFSEWLMSFGDRYQRVIDAMAALDPYFTTLTELRSQLEAVLQVHMTKD